MWPRFKTQNALLNIPFWGAFHLSTNAVIFLGEPEMYSPKYVLIKTFTQELQTTYQSVFGDRQPHLIEFLRSTAQIALETLANSDALYHNLEHTILVTSVGQEILQAKRIVNGAAAVSPENWLHFIIGLLCHDIGYLKGICAQDNVTAGQYTTGVDYHQVTLGPEATDAALTPYHVDRGKRFVAEQFAYTPLITVEWVQQIIELTRFPVPPDAMHQETSSYPGLARAADLIGQLGDRHYLQKLPGLFHEFAETGTSQTLGYRHPGDVRAGFPSFYWNVVHPYIKDAIAYLNRTQSGKQIVAQLQANVFTVEHEAPSPTLNKPLMPITSNKREEAHFIYQSCDMN